MLGSRGLAILSLSERGYEPPPAPRPSGVNQNQYWAGWKFLMDFILREASPQSKCLNRGVMGPLAA